MRRRGYVLNRRGQEAMTAGGVYRLIDECLAACGTERFALPFLDLVAATGARQVMVFDVTEARALCLLSRNFSTEPLGVSLANAYLDGWFLKDPLLPELLALPPGQRLLRRMDRPDAQTDPDYAARFFGAPGLAGKLSILATGGRRRLFVNLYFGAEGGSPDEDLALLLGHLAVLNYDGLSATGLPPALSALSARERHVCLGMLEGKKAEIIAGELGVSPATVATYRKRAYEKLGISSKAELFAICRQET